MNKNNTWYRAFVLHTRNQTETSLLVTFFVEEIGIISVTMKGARRKNSPLKGILQPFSLLKIKTITKGKSIFVTNVEQESLIIELKELYFYSAIYINELLYRLTKTGIRYDEIFLLYLQTLLEFNNKSDIEITLRKYELLLIDYLGVGPSYKYCMQTKEELEDYIFYMYSVDKGFIPAEKTTPKDRKFYGKNIKQISNLDFSDIEIKKITKDLCRTMIDNLLGNVPLRSREILMDYIKMKKIKK